MTRTGCDILAAEGFSRCSGERVGLLCNPASVDRELNHISSLLSSSAAELACLFGPQHGICGDTQANMIEWEGYIHPLLDVPVHSLYGSVRSPTPRMLEGLDTVLIDLPDVGARPYTYLWTSMLMLDACSRAGLRVIVADRPDPVGGTAVEGGLLEDAYRSFVGMFPLPMRHGMTAGEALAMIVAGMERPCELETVKMESWSREMYWEETGLPWVMPSPNIPTPDTAVVYPGMVLLEATNISEGRGTTRPFEICGAPWIDAEAFAGALRVSARACGLRGVRFRPLDFRPTWDKFQGQLCGGVQLHVTDRGSFRPVRCAAMLIETVSRLYPGHFSFLPPPYEYEEVLMPIDILSGGPYLREAVEEARGLGGLFEAWERDERDFRDKREDYLFY